VRTFRIADRKEAQVDTFYSGQSMSMTIDYIPPGSLPAYLGGPDPFAFARVRPRDRFREQTRGTRGVTKRPVQRGHRIY